MQISNAHLSIVCRGSVLRVVQHELGRTMELDWPAVRIAWGGREVRPGRATGPARATSKTMSQVFEGDALTFKVTVTLSRRRWFWKDVEIVSRDDMPTPVSVELDRQALAADDLTRCGYMPGGTGAANRGDEKGSGSIVGCGYPLIGKTLFFGLEHPAAFSEVRRTRGRERVRLWHHPVWKEERLGRVREVIGWAADGRANFAEYLESIRLPRLRSPLVCFGTFWTDPYRGDGRFDVSYESIRSFIDGFEKLGLRPDYFTLDAGWQDRQSILMPREELGGDRGLRRIKRILDERKVGLSLWVSRNGHLALDPAFLRQRGFAVGSGPGAAYQGECYAVMMDRRFERALEQRLGMLVDRLGVGHLKIDWDNECASSEEFRQRYPTVHHVRQASTDAFLRITRSLRSRAPGVIIRDGWWPSPWWLTASNHIWLSDSGDSEFCSLPSRAMRDAATTHRDLMYYQILRRDRSAVPLECFDHHELPDAPRNPFCEDPVSWANALWMCFLRGSTYIPLTLMPESLEAWQVESLRAITEFCKAYAERLYVDRGRMVLGHPGKGEIYGFVQPGRNETWCVLRNPLPIPQTIRVDAAAMAEHEVRSVYQFYPHHECLRPTAELTFLGHEVKALILSARPVKTPVAHPFMVSRRGKKYAYHLPGSAAAALGHASQRVSRLERLEARQWTSAGARTLWWFLATPHRMRDLAVQLSVRSKKPDCLNVCAFSSRYAGESRACALPVTQIPPGPEGYGERKNPTGVNHGTYYSIAVPAGGRFGLTVEISGGGGRGAEIVAWLCGYEAPGRDAIVRRLPPGQFARCLPYQHPLGFGRAIRLETGDGRG